MEGFLIILAIIGGLASMFKDKSGDKSKKKSYQAPRQTPSGHQPRRTAPERQPVAPRNTAAVQDQREEQMKKLANRMNTNAKQAVKKQPHEAFVENTVEEPKTDTYKKAEMTNQVKKNLTRKGLVDSIIMAEVLGPPRAHKPYRSVVSERKR